MSDIPGARRRIAAIADEIEAANPLVAAQLRGALAMMVRRAPVRRAPVKKAALTPETAARIRRFAAARPTMHMDEIAQAFGVNPGRVSEAMHHDV